MPLEITKGVYYVYHHLAGDTVFYVGKGVSDRPFETMKRTILWHSKVNENNGFFEVKLVGAFKSNKEALAFEALEIKRLKPYANLMNNGYLRIHTSETIEKLRLCGKRQQIRKPLRNLGGRKLPVSIQDIDTGKIYQSISAASREFGITPTVISTHLKRQSYHTHGKRFRICNDTQENN